MNLINIEKFVIRVSRIQFCQKALSYEKKNYSMFHATTHWKIEYEWIENVFFFKFHSAKSVEMNQFTLQTRYKFFQCHMVQPQCWILLVEEFDFKIRNLC